MKCNQKDCTNKASYRFTWPGSDEAGVCEEHVDKLINIARAMGQYLQVIPLEKANE